MLVHFGELKTKHLFPFFPFLLCENVPMIPFLYNIPS